MKVAIYIRVSTDKQDLTNQERELRTWAESQGHEVVAVFSDLSSGKNDYRDRQGLYDLLKAARDPKRPFELLVFWALDRLTREGTLKTLTYLESFRASGLPYHSFTEPYISTLGPFADVVISLLGTLAKMEREKISERTKAGLVTARNKGKVLGRPALAQRRLSDAVALSAQGHSRATIARKLRLSERSIGRLLASAPDRFAGASD